VSETAQKQEETTYGLFQYQICRLSKSEAARFRRGPLQVPARLPWSAVHIVATSREPAPSN